MEPSDIKKLVREEFSSLSEASTDVNVPVGTIIYISGQYVPNGWLYCDGSLVDKIVYQELYDQIGNLYGEEGNAFRIPDTRGYFLRGLDSGAGVDPGRALASIQSDSIRNIQGWLGARAAIAWQNGLGAFKLSGSSAPAVAPDYSQSAPTEILSFDASLSVPTSRENRPVNRAFFAIIKHSSHLNFN